MTSPIEGTQGDNGPIESDYEPMRPDDPHQGEGGEPVIEVDQETEAELAEAAAAAKEALAKPVEERLGFTEVPEGGVILEQFYVHDEPPAPKGGPTRSPEELSHAGVLHVPVTDELLKWATAAGAAQEAVDAILGSARGVIFVALNGVDHEGYTQVVGARTTLESAMALVTEHAGAKRDQLLGWKKYGSGTWLVRFGDKSEYYEILTLTVYQ